MNEPALVAADSGLSESERCERLCELFKNIEMPSLHERFLAPLAMLLGGQAPEGERVLRTILFVGATWRNHVARAAHLSSLRRILLLAQSGAPLAEPTRLAAEGAMRIDLDRCRRELAEAARTGHFPEEDALLALSLEATALRARTRNLAETADPYSMRTMARLLPRLRIYDELADQLERLAQEGTSLSAPDLGLHRFLDDKDFLRFTQAFETFPATSDIARVLELQRHAQWEPHQISALLSLSRSLELGHPSWFGQISFWLELRSASPLMGVAAHPQPHLGELLRRAGVAVLSGSLEIDPSRLDLLLLLNADTLSAPLSDGKRPPPPDWKEMVLCNITRETLLLSLLNNPKVTRVPGLVETVVVNCRSSQVLSVIAQKRELHTGHQNHGVPAALLRSRVKMPLTLLRRFMHVRFVSRQDLKDIAARAPRPEVAKEVAAYLATI
jgi:hypothetical protein